MNSKLSKTIFRIFNIGIFFAVPIALLSGSLVTPDREYSERENRSLAKFPEISLTSITSGDFMSRFETYISDQIWGRETVVSAKSSSEKLLGKTEQNGVYIGKDGWLFEKPSVYNESKVKITTSAISDFCSDCGIENQMFVLVPNSTSIVTQKLPQFSPPSMQDKSIKSIYSTMPDSVKCLDAYSIMNSADDKESLYYRNDHHWTSSGAKLVFDGIAEKWNFDKNVKFDQYTLSDSFYGTLSSSSGIKEKPDIIDAFVPQDSAGTYTVQNTSEMTKTASLFNSEKLKNTNQYEVFMGGNFSKIVISTTADTNNRLLIFKDSYANCMLPMLTPYFNEIVVIDARYYTDEIKDVVQSEGFTHLMFLYNVNTFLEDTSLKDVI